MILYFWGLILPWLIVMMTNTLTFIGLGVAIGAILWLFLAKQPRNLLFYGYKSIMRFLTGLFIEIDPIGILKTYVSNLKDRLEEMDRSIENLNGQAKKLEIQIAKNKEGQQTSLAKANAAHKRGDEMKSIFMLESRQAARLEKSTATLEDLYGRMQNLLKTLRRMRESSSVMVSDIENEVNLKTVERAALLAGYNAFSKAKRIMQGGGDEKEMFDMTLERLASDYGAKMGEIEMFMDMSKGIIDGVELDGMIDEEKALAQFALWEQKSQNLLSGSTTVRVETKPEVRVSTDTDAFLSLFDQSPDSVNRSARK
jgi:hypothetical protein